MANKVYSYYKDLPSWAKGVVVVGGIAIVYLTAKQIIARLRSQAEKKNQVATFNAEADDLKNLTQSGVKPSFSNSQYRIWADAIQKQFTGCDKVPKVPFLPASFFGYAINLSGSGASFVNIIKDFKNDVDFLMLNQAWGSNREYDDCLWGKVSGNLPMVLRDELDDNEITAINNALKKKGINYKY